MRLSPLVAAVAQAMRGFAGPAHGETLVVGLSGGADSTADPEAGVRMRKDRKRRVRERERREAQGAGEKGVP